MTPGFKPFTRIIKQTRLAIGTYRSFQFRPEVVTLALKISRIRNSLMEKKTIIRCDRTAKTSPIGVLRKEGGIPHTVICIPFSSSLNIPHPDFHVGGYSDCI